MFRSTDEALSEIRQRLDFVMTPEEESVALKALEDLQVLARLIGKNWLSHDRTPDLVRVLIYRATVRYMRNMDGLIRSRAGDEEVQFPDRAELGSAAFSQDEMELLKQQNGEAVVLAFGTIGTYVYGNTGQVAGIDSKGGALVDEFSVG